MKTAKGEKNGAKLFLQLESKYKNISGILLKVEIEHSYELRRKFIAFSSKMKVHLESGNSNLLSSALFCCFQPEKSCYFLLVFFFQKTIKN